MTNPTPPAAQTAKQRNAALRARRAEQGLTQCVVYAHKEHHAAIRALAAQLSKSKTKATP